MNHDPSKLPAAAGRGEHGCTAQHLLALLDTAYHNVDQGLAQQLLDLLYVRYDGQPEAARHWPPGA